MTKTSPNESKKTKSAKSPRLAKQELKSRTAKTKAPAGRKKRVETTNLTKSEQCLTLLKRAEGVTLAELMSATGWQSHSVRGFLSGTVKRKLGLTLISDKGVDGMRRYRIVRDAA